MDQRDRQTIEQRLAQARRLAAGAVDETTQKRLKVLIRELEGLQADKLRADAEQCRQQARDADTLTRSILLEVANQYEAQARLLSACPKSDAS